MFVPRTAPPEGRRVPLVKVERSMLSLFRRLMVNTSGATAVECTLIVSLIAVAAIASMRSVGSKVSILMGSVGTTTLN